MINFVATNLQGLLQAAALLTVGVGALYGFTRTPLEDGGSTVGYSLGKATRPILVGVAGLLVVSTVAFTPRGYAGVVFDMGAGVLAEERREGVSLTIPVWQHLSNVNVQIQVLRLDDPEVFQHTADTQEIRVPTAINWRVQFDQADYVYRDLNNDPLRIVVGASNRALRVEVGSLEFEAISANQNSMATSMEVVLGGLLAPHGIDIILAAIEDTVAKPGIIAAIEAEKVAARNKITAAHERDIVEIQAQGKAFEAEGIRHLGFAEADVAAALAVEVTPELIQYELAKAGVRYLPDTLVTGSEFPIILDVNPE
jgi:hypothetical protein